MSFLSVILNNANAATTGFCTKTADIWQLVGNILRIAQIVLILAVIIFGVMDFGKAVVGKDDDLKKAAKQIAFRIIAVVIILFIPTLVGAIFSMIDAFTNNIEAEYSKCAQCVTHPGGNVCKGYVNSN